MDKEKLKEIVDEIINLLLMKNNHYGSKNLELTGLVGVSVRLLDKASRLYNLSAHKVITPERGESIEDTLKDIAGYALISLYKLREGTITPNGILGGGFNAGNCNR